MSGGLLCLKWNNHSLAFDKLLNNLHLKEIYSDATLVCNGKFYPVHQFVLSTCSEYFHEIFLKSFQKNCKHPFIVMGDLQEGQIELLLNYMYRGEINVPQELLPSLLKAAETLKIKGLAVRDDDPEDTLPKKHDNKRNHISSSPSPKKSRRSDSERKSLSSPEPNRPNSTESIDAHKVLLASPPSLSMHETREKQSFNEEEQVEATVKSEPVENSDYLDESSETLDPLHDLRDENNQPLNSLSKSEGEEMDACSNQSFSNSSNSNNHFDPSSWNDSQTFNNKHNLNETDASTERILSNSALSEGTSSDTPSSSKSFMETNNLSLAKELQRSLLATRLMFQPKLSLASSKLKEKQFLCQVCSYRFLTKHELKVHMRKHTGEKPYVCMFCPYRSSQSANLQTHLKTHTGEKPFVCPYCPYRATQKVSLLSHLKRHIKP